METGVLISGAIVLLIVSFSFMFQKISSGKK